MRAYIYTYIIIYILNWNTSIMQSNLLYSNSNNNICAYITYISNIIYFRRAKYMRILLMLLNICLH